MSWGGKCPPQMTPLEITPKVKLRNERKRLPRVEPQEFDTPTLTAVGILRSGPGEGTHFSKMIERNGLETTVAMFCVYFSQGNQGII